jgi:D-3-phosphoglycerate dehydrogenase / 2-oxoglutarate reductase
MRLKAAMVLVTPTSYGMADPRLRSELERQVGTVVYNPMSRPLSSAELGPLLADCDGYIAGLDEVDQPALRQASRLKVIGRYGAGVDNVDLEAARERGIVVTNTPGANSASVAELTLAFLLALSRDLPAMVQATRDGHWARAVGVSLQGKAVGLVGLGAIGKQVARRLQGFECMVLAYDPAPDVQFAERFGVRLSPLDEVVTQADFLSLHLPLSPETKGFVNAGLLGKMKRGSFLINTARGELVDESALLEALRDGQLRGAALDAFGEEPPPREHPLLAHPQVIATPHLGAHTDGAMSAMGWAALKDCLAVLRGEAPEHRVV